MQKRTSFTSENPESRIRKSPRLFQRNISPNQESKPSNFQVCTSSSKKSHLISSSISSSVSSKVNFKKTQKTVNPRNLTKDSVKLVDGSSKSDNGLRKSRRFADKEVSVVDNKKRDLGEIKNRSRVLGEIELGVNLMEEGEEKEKGNGNMGVGEMRQKRKSTRGGKENLDSRKLQKRNDGTCLRSPFSSSENINKKTGSEESNEKKLVKSTKLRTKRVEKVEEDQSIRRSSRFSNAENMPVLAESSEKIEKKKSIKSAKSRTERVEKVQGNRRSSRISSLDVSAGSSERMVKSAGTERVEKVQGTARISNFEIVHVYASSECSDGDEISPAVMPNVLREKKLERKLVKSVKSRTERVEEVQGLRQSSRVTNLESTRVYVSNECSDTDVSPAVMRNVESKEKRIVMDGRVKEKNPAEEKSDVHGWTKDQDVALQRAYFAAKPAPNFWKKVSKMVPGKTAQECFDKIHSDLVTPPQAQPRSRAKKTISSPLSHFSLSGSKLLEPSLNVRWPKDKKQRKLRAQKTLRHLVQKRSMVDQGYEADLFSVLEPIMSAPIQDFSQTELLSTPETKSNKKGCIQECQENSSIRKKPLSRFRNSCETALVSPPVLKQVKNKALHEKFIDRLHSRDARRTAGPRKCSVAIQDRKESTANKMDDITVARNALVFEANDMINKFQEAQANIVSDYDDSQDGDTCDSEDDEDC
ncbi:hypothetical protein MKW94_024656 [Papaver nudicaule]|uniref:Myb-like domain-containing protein n=1 Tax=Papaver nudicaule TaxID=74823 RepID=A0AA41SB96_PAPNU|nr:hypothetical protein [Papaver nudicaule]